MNERSKVLPHCPVTVMEGDRQRELSPDEIKRYFEENPEDWWIAYDNAAFHKYQIAVQCIARQEELYFKEWIEHHLKIGIEHIYIYDNNDEDGLVDFLREQLAQEDFEKIQVIAWHHPMSMQQFSAVTHCCKKFENEMKWLLSIDLDEFFVLEKPLDEFLKEFSYASQVYFSWESFGADGKLYYEDLPVQKRFNKTFECHDAGQGKAMFRPSRMNRWNIHAVRIKKGKTVNTLHDEIVAPDSFANIYKKAWIKHYYTKSLEEWENKIRRGCADNLFCRAYYDFFEINPELVSDLKQDFQRFQRHGNALLGTRGCVNSEHKRENNGK